MVKIISILVALFATQGIIYANSLKCNTGVEKTCPKGQECYSPFHEPGSEGTCGKMCKTGTQKACPKGYSCLSHSTTPGSPGACISDSECTDNVIELDRLQNVLVKSIVNMYDNFFDSMSKALFKQVISGEGGRVDCDRNNTCPIGSFCLSEPGLVDPNPEGKCYKYIPNEGRCITGTENSCPTDQKCMSPTGGPPGSVGWCVPSDAKECMSGTMNSCQKGYMCMTPPGSPPGAKGYCMKDDPCMPLKSFESYIQYWQFNNQRSAYRYNIDKRHQEMVAAEIAKKN